MSELRFALIRLSMSEGNVFSWLFRCVQQKGVSTLPGGQPLSKSKAIVTLRLIFDYAGAGGQLALVWQLVKPATNSNKATYVFFTSGGKAHAVLIDGKLVEVHLGVQHLKGPQSKKVRICQGHMFPAGSLGMDLSMVLAVLRGLRGEVRVEVVDVANPSTIKQFTLTKGSALVELLAQRDAFLQPPYAATAATVATVVPLAIQELLTESTVEGRRRRGGGVRGCT
jgi:hypothetical protein